MKLLITGITGFAGPHLANLLIKEGHDVYGLSRRNNGMESDIMDVVPQEYFSKIKFFNCDLCDKEGIDNKFKDNEFDCVYSLGAQSHPPTSFTNTRLTFDTNINGSFNLIESISKHQRDNCLFGFCSTSEVYGNIGIDGRKINENDQILPANPYGVSKAAIDLYVQERIRNGYLNGFITRAFSHTGPRRGSIFSISSDAIRLAIMKSNGKKDLEVGNLETTRVVMDVRDTVRAYYLISINPSCHGKVFNVCGDTPRKMEYFTDKLIEISGIEGVKKVISDKLYRKHDIFYQHGDTSLLKTLTGWEPLIDINETLSDLFKYWERKI